MGLLSEGSPLTWEETKKHADHVRKHGIVQFLNQYKKLKSKERDVLYWGDEVEYMIVKFDDENKTAKLSLKAGEVLNNLQQCEKLCPQDHPTTWRPEYAAYMVEGTPGKPYGGLLAHFNVVESNMKLRRKEIEQALGPNEKPLSLTVYPRLGVGSFTEPETKTTPQDGASKSLFFPDQTIFQGHPRFRTLSRNIRQRKGSKVEIQVPVYKDLKTKSPFVEDYSQLGDDGEAARTAKPDHIYMDCMGFGMGCSCLQVTFQACNIDEARLLYDQLAPLCPIMLALSAASPVYRGYLSDIDVRWTVIAQSVDDRTDEERGKKPLKNDRYRINKSRYDSIDSYLTPGFKCYNDIDLVLDQEICDDLIKGGVDEALARHIAHLFIRDPISLFSEKLNQNDEEDTDHFENIQSTNWQTMRFKPPPPNSKIGWRVEFRPMEVQLSDFENAAYTVFIVLLTRVVLSYGLNFIIPISKVDENMATAHKRDAVNTEKFYFRKEVFTECSPNIFTQCMTSGKCQRNCSSPDDEYQLMSMNEIFNGSDEFPGLIPMIKQYLNSVDVDVDTSCTIQNYLKLISNRASGKEPTIAKCIRHFVTEHPDYKQDSVVSEIINYDLLKLIDEKTEKGETMSSEHFSSKTHGDIPQALSKTEKFLNGKKPHKHLVPELQA